MRYILELEDGSKYYGNHFGFNKLPKNKKEYFKILKNINKIKKPDNSSIIKAKIFLLTNYDISKTKSTFIPENIPRFESRMNFDDQNKFWELLKIKNLNYKVLKDPFFLMFKEQISLKNRHTINFLKYNVKNKKFNDLY